MIEAANDQQDRRGFLSRLGISALNLITPGLGLLRLRQWRPAVFFLLSPFALMTLMTVGMGHFPITSFGRGIFALAVVIGLLALIYLVPTALTWRESRFRSPLRPWSRWYGLIGAWIAVMLGSFFALPLMHSFYKPFYAPSESMAPTIRIGDKFIADMKWQGPLTRGTIIIFNAQGLVRVSRIAALPGDRVAMRNGVPLVNGKSATQSVHRKIVIEDHGDKYPATLLSERLLGEASTHHILDSGPFEFDDTPELVVPANHFFVLGDNRDRSADSRVPQNVGGVGMVPFTAIIGRPMYIH